MRVSCRSDRRHEDGSGETGNGIGLRGRTVPGVGGGQPVRRVRVHDRGQVHNESVRPVIPRPVSQVRDVRVKVGSVVFRVEREAVLPSGLRKVSGPKDKEQKKKNSNALNFFFFWFGENENI